MKVHKIVLLVINNDDIETDQEIVNIIENVNYPNDCLSPHVMAISTREVEWSDDHPLNKSDTQEAAFRELFNDKTAVQTKRCRFCATIGPHKIGEECPNCGGVYR